MHVCVITHFSSSLSGSSVHGIYQATILEWGSKYLPPGDLLNPGIEPIPPQFSSVTQSCLTLWPHGLQHPRPPCPSPTPRVYSNSCPLSWWCHPTISSCHPLFFQYHLGSPKIGYLSATFYFHLICHNAFFYISKYLLHSFLFVHLFI